MFESNQLTRRIIPSNAKCLPCLTVHHTAKEALQAPVRIGAPRDEDVAIITQINLLAIHQTSSPANPVRIQPKSRELKRGAQHVKPHKLRNKKPSCLTKCIQNAQGHSTQLPCASSDIPSQIKKPSSQTLGTSWNYEKINLEERAGCA